MKKLSVSVMALFTAAVFFESCSNANSEGVKVATAKPVYVCLPCGRDCDTASYQKQGNCSLCQMELVDKNTIRFNKIEPNQLCNFYDEKGHDNVVLLDVRTPAEFNGTAEQKFGRLKNAINIPVQELAARVQELEKYKDKEILVYCSHSHRSPAASYLLNQKGFLKITNMQGGMSVWKESVTDKACNDRFYISQQ